MSFPSPRGPLPRPFCSAALLALVLASAGCGTAGAPGIEATDVSAAAPHVRLAASLALERGDASSLETLSDLLGDPDWIVRAQAAAILARRGEPAVEILGPATLDAEARVRIAALSALHSISGSLTVPWLVGALDDKEARVRIRSLRALADVGLLGSEEAARAVELLGDPNGRARRWASIVAIRAGGSAVPPLETALGREPDRRWRAAWALGQLGPRASSALPRLRELAAGDDARVAEYARTAIALIEAGP